MKNSALIVVLSLAAVTVTGCMAPTKTIRSHQRISSRVPYARPPGLVGRRIGRGAVRLGATAEHSLMAKNEGVRKSGEGIQELSSTHGQVVLGFGVADVMELGLSLGAFAGEQRANNGPSPLELLSDPMFTGGTEARLVFGDRIQWSVNFGLRLHQVAFSWDYSDTCTGPDCDYFVDQGGALNQVTPAFGAFTGFGVDIALNDRISLLVGGTLELLPTLPTSKTGLKQCGGSATLFDWDNDGCVGAIPPKPPEVELGIGGSAYVGLGIHVFDSLRANLIVQPYSMAARSTESGRKDVAQYMTTQLGIEAVF